MVRTNKIRTLSNDGNQRRMNHPPLICDSIEVSENIHPGYKHIALDAVLVVGSDSLEGRPLRRPNYSMLG